MRRWVVLPYGWALNPEEPLALLMALPVKVEKLILYRSFKVWDSGHMDSSTQRGQGLSLQDHQFRTIISLKCDSVFFYFSQLHFSPSLIPHVLFYTSCPLTLSAPLCIPPLSPAHALPQTRAKRLILALRPSKLSRLSSFSPLSLSILSNTLPVVMDTREQAGAFDLLVCGRSQQPVSKIITLRPPQMCQDI